MGIDVVLFLHNDMNAVRFCVMRAQKKSRDEISCALGLPVTWITAIEAKMKACGIVKADGKVDDDALKYAQQVAVSQIKKVGGG